MMYRFESCYSRRRLEERNRGVCEENMCYLCAIYAFIENAENTGREIRDIGFYVSFYLCYYQ